MNSSQPQSSLMSTDNIAPKYFKIVETDKPLEQTTRPARITTRRLPA